MSYGATVADAVHQAGIYVGEFSAVPRQLIEFVTNLKTAKALDCAADAARARRRGDRIDMLQCECPLLAVSSTNRRNTF